MDSVGCVHLSVFMVLSHMCNLPMMPCVYHHRCWLLDFMLVSIWMVFFLFSLKNVTSRISNQRGFSRFSKCFDDITRWRWWNPQIHCNCALRNIVLKPQSAEPLYPHLWRTEHFDDASFILNHLLLIYLFTCRMFQSDGFLLPLSQLNWHKIQSNPTGYWQNEH